MYGVDVAELAVKVSEGSLYPNLAVVATASKNCDPPDNVNKQTLASVVGQLTVPLYQGGGEFSHHPAIEGDAWPATPQSRRQPRSGA